MAKMPDWKQHEGELAGGEFPLERYLAGSEAGALFLTRFASGRAVVKMVLAGQSRAAELVERWNRAAALHHPHLVRIFAVGTGTLAEALAYLHGQGLAHGNLKPSNILAVEDTVKLSSETVSAGDPAADIRALGVVLVQALQSSAIAAGVAMHRGMSPRPRWRSKRPGSGNSPQWRERDRGTGHCASRSRLPKRRRSLSGQGAHFDWR
jgi:hypothetical protein